jgi:serine/threonine-protein kinase
LNVYDVGEWLDRPWLRRLHSAHEAGIVHRDVKPANVLLRDDGLVKIADFGIATAAGATGLTGAGTVLGTAAYLAPEHARGEAASLSADLYAVGVLLYELLTGTTPYPARTLPELVAMQSKGKVTPLRERQPGVPRSLERLVLRCLSPDPRERPASAAELGRELAEAALPASPPDLPTVALHGPKPPRRRGRLRWRPPDPREWPRPAAVGAGVLLLAITATSFAVAWPDTGTGSSPVDRAREPVFESVPKAADPADVARNLSDWLRSHSR